MIQIPNEYTSFVQKVVNAYPKYVEIEDSDMAGYLNELAELQIFIVR
jgi:hypothetical protein